MEIAASARVQCAAGSLLVVALMLCAAPAAAPAAPAAPSGVPARCRLAPLCLCHLEHFICNDVPFHQIPDIDEGVLHVSVSGARLDALEEGSLPGGRALHTLQLHDSALHALHPAALTASAHSLASLDLAHNHLADLPLAALLPLSALHWLNLNNNHIVELKGGAGGTGAVDWGALADSLTSLSLSNNELCVVHAGALSGLRRLARLDLEGNRLRVLSPAALPPALSALLLAGNLLSNSPSDLLHALPRLQYLRLRDNMLHTTPPSPPPPAERTPRRLDTLDLAYNQLGATALAGVLRDVTMRHLVLDLNELSAFPPHVWNYSRVERLSASHNRLTSLPAGALRRLRRDLLHLQLDHNHLSELPLSMRELARCRVLSLAYNDLRELHALPPRLRVLDAAGNYLATWPLELKHLATGELRRLDLSYNRLESLGPVAWGPWSSALEILDLRGNRLTTLSPSSSVAPTSATVNPSSPAAAPPSLRELLLGFNDLFSVSEGALDAVAPSLRVLELSSSHLGGQFPAGAALPLLEWLAMDDSDVQDMTSRDLARLPALEFLNLEFNKLEQFPSEFSTPPSEQTSRVRDLRLAYNLLSVVEWRYFSTLNELCNLDLANNLLSVLPSNALVNLPNLQYFSLAGNLITSLVPRSLRKLPHLRHLHLQGNLLTDLSISSFEYVGDPDESLVLNVSNNRISTLKGGGAFPGHLYITVLDLSHNLISSVSWSFFESVASNLRHVDLSNNLLTRLELPSGPSSLLARLETLLLRHNNISAIYPVEAPELALLDLRDNSVRGLPGGMVRGTPRLSRLLLAGNLLRALPRDALAGAALEHLDLSNNRVQVFPAGALAAAGRLLCRLELAGNALEHLDAAMFIDLPALRDLSLRGNALTVLPDNTFASLTRLRRLDLARNMLKTNFKELFHNLPELRQLSLAGCGLRTLPRLPLANLTALDLNENRVTSWRDADLRALPALRVLGLARNELGSLRPGAWAAAPGLVALDLAHNPLLALSAACLEHLTRLQRLSIAFLEHLETVDARALRPLVSLRVLEVDVPAGGVMPGALLQHAGQVEVLTLQVCGSVLDEQLAGLHVPKLRSLEVRGKEVAVMSARSLAALGGARALALRVAGTGLRTLPAGLLEPLGRLPHLALLLTDNRYLTDLQPAVFYHNLSDWNRRATTLLPGGLVLSGNALRCGCSVSWLGGWLRRWAAESGGGAGAGAVRSATCRQHGGGAVPLVALHSDPAECAASALSSRAAPSPRAAAAPHPARAAVTWLALLHLQRGYR